jgi:predicted TIM-barrel fold metal-dependent hydrolase
MGLDVTGRYRYPPPRPDWLARSVEEAIDPDRPIIDAHHHFWTEGGHAYLLDDLLADAACGHSIAATVFVEARHFYRTDGPAHLASVGETEHAMAAHAAAQARGNAPKVAAAIVAHADLTSGGLLDEVLAAHRQAAGASLGASLGAIRHSVVRDEYFPEGIVLRPAPRGLLGSDLYRAGLARLPKHGLAYEAMVYHRQIPELTDMARALPELQIMLDHAGCVLGVGPYEGRETETYAEWARDLKLLATCPNVHVKIGGFGMIVCGARWHEQPEPPGSAVLADAWRPYVETCIEAFGPQRCAFESNFPVDKAMYSYCTLWNAFKRLTAAASEADRDALFHGTAARFYGIDLAASGNA